jgi:hypothetical protein
MEPSTPRSAYRVKLYHSAGYFLCLAAEKTLNAGKGRLLRSHFTKRLNISQIFSQILYR